MRLVSPVMDCRPVQGAPRLSPNGSGSIDGWMKLVSKDTKICLFCNYVYIIKAQTNFQIPALIFLSLEMGFPYYTGHCVSYILT